MTKLYNMYFNTMSNLKSRFKDEKGQGLVEYVLIIAVIALGVITTMGLVTGQLKDTFTAIKAGLAPVAP
jgi:Flp pilus assembly pilin Flp